MRNMKKIVLTAVLALMGMGVFAQQKPVVAVAPFEAVSGITPADANVITGIFNTRLGNANVVTLVDRSVVERVIQEHKFQLGDWSNKDKTAALGDALNADWIVRGEIAKLGADIIVNVQFYDIKTFQFKGGADISFANVNEARAKITPLVDSLVQTIGGGTGTKPPAAVTGDGSFRQEGLASWYGAEFDGRPTASGEMFNSTLFTAAHPSLPYGTFLLVTNKMNNRQITVKVNDRGPFVAGRIIDLSKAAAERLDMIAAGIVPVIIETMPTYLPPPPPVSTSKPAPVSNSTFTAPPVHINNIRIIPALPSPHSGKIYRLLVGTYSSVDSAFRVFRQLQATGFEAVQDQAGNMYRVFAVGIPASSVYDTVQRLGAIGFEQVWIIDPVEAEEPEIAPEPLNIDRDIFCRTWKIVNSNKSDYIGYIMEFSDDGTYLTTNTNGETFVGKWRWYDEHAAFEYTHNNWRSYGRASIHRLDQGSLTFNDPGFNILSDGYSPIEREDVVYELIPVDNSPWTR